MEVLRKKEYIILILFLSISLLADILTTLYILSTNPGSTWEANPFMKYIVNVNYPGLMILLKGLLLVIALLFAEYALIKNSNKYLPMLIFILPALVTYIAAFWNIYFILH